jgi:hypothetical protein
MIEIDICKSATVTFSGDLNQAHLAQAVMSPVPSLVPKRPPLLSLSLYSSVGTWTHVLSRVDLAICIDTVLIVVDA